MSWLFWALGLAVYAAFVFGVTNVITQPAVDEALRDRPRAEWWILSLWRWLWQPGLIAVTLLTAWFGAPLWLGSVLVGACVVLVRPIRRYTLILARRYVSAQPWDAR